MRPLLQHASRALFANTVLVAPQRASNAAVTTWKTTAPRTSSICWSCQSRSASALVPMSSRVQLNLDNGFKRSFRRRQFSSQNTPEKEKDSNASEAIQMPPPPSWKEPAHPEMEEPNVSNVDTPTSPSFHAEEIQPEKEEPSHSSESIQMPPPESTIDKGKPQSNEMSEIDGTSASSKAQFEDTIARVPDEDLPSHKERQRWDFSKRVSELMDELLPKLAVVTQKVNTYTGTDYSSIEALRLEIKDQEKLVKARRLAIEDAKQALDVAHAQQGSSQKEVVALLERKHSWSAADLERYMSLIRSEHLNDQAIREAKDAVQEAENALEEARSQLEKRERQQYHEEQIWSDTIRRNSTWVTFGLMGLNIFLLLLSLLFLEPWRRRRMVREIKAALADAQIQKPAVAVAPVAAPIAAIEAGNDKVVVDAVSPPPQAEQKASEAATQDQNSTAEVVPAVTETEPAQTEPESPYHTANPVTEPSETHIPDETEVIGAMNIEEEVKQDMTRLEKITAKIERIPAKLEELVSDEPISVRRKDLTAAICVSLAAGYACAVIAFWLGTR